ncbi:MAG TPA: hypothetical protein VE007_09855 [Thermoanaerobaculia bacterium]|nr:hypothetical protein [Thermoanaerobaculia bacterium]
MKKKAGKSKAAAKSVKNLPAKTLKGKDSKAVKGGTSLSYSSVQVEYKPQKPDGTL